MQKEAATRVAQTKQFQDLKKMVMQKNQQIKEIRTRLDKYEPSAAAGTASADDDDSSDDE
jgi:predicted  nucleic acid-binding Zn-ribbon protein